MGILRTLMILVLVLGTSVSFAAPFQNFPGSIPLQYERQAASDLVYKGKRLLPDEARSLFEKKVVSDLSTLDPIETSNLWRNEFPKLIPASTDEMGIQLQGDEVQYVSETEVPVGRFGFIVTKTFSNGQSRAYQVVADLKNQNVLLRKQLLRKIGYQIPAVSRMATLKVKFKGVSSKDLFVKEFDRKTFEQADRWITGGREDSSEEIILQDVLIFEGANDPYYNVARGDISSGVIQGRRLMNALLVPFNLTDVPESINLFSWLPGRIFNKQLILAYDDAEEFSTAYEDARWILRRILRLQRADWVEIVAAGEYPQEVQALLVEKLISRRNFFREKLGLENESVEISINSNVSLGERLVEGKLKSEAWPGYAAHFSAADPDSPLSNSEVFGLFKSKVLSNILSNLVVEFNDRFVPHTDLGFKIFDHQLDVAAKQLADFIITGKMKEVPFGFWATDVYGGNLIAAREVVAGSFQGSENIVQLADTVGLAVDAGAYIGADGLPTKVTFSGGAKAFFVRTYTHLKPIRSIKSALKEPFRNMMVTWLKKNQSTPLDELLKLDGKAGELEPEEYEKLIGTQLDEFKKRLGVGESLIVQTNLGVDLQFQPGYGISDQVQVYLNLKDKLTVLSRLHIYRRDANTIQIFRDPAFYNLLDISLALRARIQVLEVGWSWLKGTAKTEFWNLDLTPDFEGNSEFFKNVAAIRRALRQSRLDTLRRTAKPWVIGHEFSEVSSRARFLFLKSLKSRLKDTLTVETPEGDSRQYIRRTMGQRFGRDYESLAIDVLNALIDEFAQVDASVTLTTHNSGNPGDTYKGSAVSRQVSLEGQLDPTGLGTRLNLENLYLGVDYRWKGWEISQKKALRILEEIRNKYGSDIFPEILLNDSEKLQFYSVDLNVALYEEGAKSLLGWQEADLLALYARYSVVPGNNRDFVKAHTRLFLGYLKRIEKNRKKGNAEALSGDLAKLFGLAESTLTFEGLTVAVGGVDNLFVRGTIHGFRVGDAAGEQDVFSHSIGQLGTTRPGGPLKVLQRQLGISEGEMLIYWLLNRL